MLWEQFCRAIRSNKLVFPGQNSGCINSGWVTARGTKCWYPTFPWGTCLWGFVYHCFTPRWHKRKLVPILWAVDSLMCQHIGIDTQWVKHIKGIFDLQGKSVPQLEWEIDIGCGEHTDKVVLKGLYYPLCCISTMVMGSYQHQFALVLGKKFLYGLTCLVVHDV